MTSLPNALFNLLRGYASLTPPMSLAFPTELTPSLVQDFLLNSILHNSHLNAYPPSKRYQYRFWKWIIEGLTDLISSTEEDVEIDGVIYDRYVSTLPPPASPGLQNSPPPPSYISHFWNFESNTEKDWVDLGQYHTITLLESRTTIESGTTGLRTWLASYVLSQFLISHPELITGKRVLEFGSGTGFLGIVVATMQQTNLFVQESSLGSNQALWLTDVHEEVLLRCRTNVQLPCNLSSSHKDVHFHLLDWNCALDPLDVSHLRSLFNDEIQPDIILGADVVYDPSLILPFVKMLYFALTSSCGTNSMTALIALTVRNEQTMETFLKTAAPYLNVEDLHVNHTSDLFKQVRLDSGEDVKIFRINIKGGDSPYSGT